MFAALTSPLPALTARERISVALIAVAVGATRIFALSRTLWDWDEALFSLALRSFSVPLHHPHPPGFPLFIAAAKLFHNAGLSEFHALQAVTLLGALGVMPAMFFLARELRCGFVTAVSSGVLLAFLPNVWFFGGTAFSDVPSMTLGVLSAALLLRGCRDSRSFFAGAVVLGIAAGFRPQNLLIGCAPALLALACQWRVSILRSLAAVAIGGTILVTAYGGAAYFSGGWTIYRQALETHQKYITEVDSFRNPGRPSLRALFDDFFYRPFRFPALNGILAFFMIAGILGAIVQRRAGVLLAFAIFAPFCLFAWLVLDHFSVSRFSIAYMPLHAYLAAEGIRALSRSRAALEAAAGLGLPAAFMVITFPAIAVVRGTASPPVAAASWIRNNVHREGSLLYVHGSMWPLSEALLPDYAVHFVEEYTVTKFGAEANAYYLQEGIVRGEGGRVFARPRKILSRLVRDRYFETSVVPVTGMVSYADGWHAEESSGLVAWRWMGRQSRMVLPSLAQPKAQLILRLYVPLDALPKPPSVEVRFNGAVIDRFQPSVPDVVRTYEVRLRPASPNELTLHTDRVVMPRPGDPRTLGLRLNGVEWHPMESR